MMLVTRSKYDQGTNYLYCWTSLVIAEADKRDIAVIDLADNKATKSNFVSYYKKHQPKLVFFNGHGFDNLVTGNNDEVLIDNDKNRLDMTGSIIVARSCRCAKVLGKFLVKNGSLAFIGFKDDYVIKTSRKYSTRPLLDSMAALFLEPSNMIVKSLLKGKTAGESDKKSKKMLINNLSKVLSGTSKDKDDTARWLYHDFKNQVVVGDEEANSHQGGGR